MTKLQKIIKQRFWQSLNHEKFKSVTMMINGNFVYYLSLITKIV